MKAAPAASGALLAPAPAGGPSVSWRGEQPSLDIFTLVLWTGSLLIGLLGFAISYQRPHPAVAEPPPLVAEPLAVDLQPAPAAPSRPSQSEMLDPPPHLEPFSPPEAPPLQSIAELARPIAFAVPVVPHQATEATHSTSVASAAPPVLEVLTYGMGEGKQPAPHYPRRAVREGQEGTVLVRFSVEPDGRVRSAEAVLPSPWPLLNEAALQAVREQWRFAPGGSRLYEVSIRFELTR